MKVYMGPYYHWFQPARWYKQWVLWFHGLGDKADWENIPDASEKYEDLIEKLHKDPIYDSLLAIERRVDSVFKRKVSVKIDHYDVWGMDATLAKIILPMLKLLREKKQGAPFVDDDDVPPELQSTAAPPVEEWETDDNHFKRWDWVMDEMIWAFEQILDDDADSQFHSDIDPAKPRLEPGISFDESMRRGKFDKDAYMAWQHRKTHGLTLFGKYFQSLWD